MRSVEQEKECVWTLTYTHSLRLCVLTDMFSVLHFIYPVCVCVRERDSPSSHSTLVCGMSCLEMRAGLTLAPFLKTFYRECIRVCVCFVGGAGGKGVWGTPGEVYDVEEVDVRDPNYDEDQVVCLSQHLGGPSWRQSEISRTRTPSSLSDGTSYYTVSFTK